MTDDRWDSWVIANIGQARECDLCRRPVPCGQLREIWLPLTVFAGWGALSPEKAQWVCARCPG